MKPSVTIGIPTFNRRDLLQDTLRSASSQTYESLEILVSDNCGSDDTEDVVRRHAESDSRIRFHRTSENLGAYGNIAEILRVAEGDYVKFMCSDDVFLTDAVSTMAGHLENSDVALVCCKWLLFDRNGPTDPVPWWAVPVMASNSLVYGTSLADLCLAKNVNYVGCASNVMIRRKEVRPEAVARYCGRHWEMSGDLVTWLPLIRDRLVAYLVDPLVGIRTHEGQEAKSDSSRGLAEREWLDLVIAAGRDGFLTEPSARAEALNAATRMILQLPGLAARNGMTETLVGDLRRAADEFALVWPNDAPAEVIGAAPNAPPPADA